MATRKEKPKLSFIVIIATRKKRTHPDHLLYLWQQEKNKPTPTTYSTYGNTKKWIAIEFFLLSM
jgi:hypothetical protein